MLLAPGPESGPTAHPRAVAQQHQHDLEMFQQIALLEEEDVARDSTVALHDGCFKQG